MGVVGGLEVKEQVITERDRTNEEPVALAVKAADHVFDGGDSDVYEPEDGRTARAAVLRLGERFAELPRVIAEALEGAQNSGELLSSDRLQGLAEILQNADDANASEVRLVLRENDLLVGHNGDPVRLPHVLGLATPWFSTKGSEAELFGRFGIGLSALRSLSRAIEVHCIPYHVRLGDPTLSPIEAMKLPAAFDGHDWTVFRVPLGDTTVGLKDLGQWLDRWGDGGLLFLRNVSQVELRASAGEVIGRLLVRREPAGSAQLAGTPSGVTVHRQVVETAGGLSWMVYTAEVASPTEVSRVRKAKEPTTPIGVALPLYDTRAGKVYAGLPVVSTPFPVFLNAQFDPLTSRNDLADTEWNRALVPLVASIWTHAAVDLFRRSPEAAWRAMPVQPSSDGEAASLMVATLNGAILNSARKSVAEEVAVEVPGEGWVRLGELAVESEPLEGVVTEEETATLLGLRATLPLGTRDSGGKWRTVLDDWRAAGADLPEPLGVERSLDLLQDEARSVPSMIALAAAGLRDGLRDRLGTMPSVVASDGRRLVPPSKDSAEALAEKMSPLAEALGIVTALHQAYLEDTDDARVVIKWLRERGALLDETDDRVVLRRLAAAGRSGHPLAEPLTDGQVDALRRAFELIDMAERTELGRDVGRAIALEAYKYQPGGRGRRRRTVAAPADAYLPRSIDRGKESFAVAAGKAPGIVWLDDRYGRTLRSPDGRAGIGARRLLTLLGAETAPRPRPHRDLEDRFYAQPPGLPKLEADGPAARSAAMADLTATYTLADSDCPAMTAAVEDIARVRQGKKRRTRAAALLTTVGRAWERLSDFSEVVCAYDHYSWKKRGRTAAFWLWRARDIAWLDDESGTPRRPSELRLRTPGTEAIFGTESQDFLHPDLRGSHSERRNWQAAMSALGTSGDPTQRELVDRLRDLRDDVAAAETITRDAAIVYRALAESLAAPASRSDLTRKDLRRAFEEGDGLIATKLGWGTPGKVFAGPAVFGRYMPFAPQVPGTDELWKVLRLAEPSLADCIKVLRRIARGRRALNADDETVMLETLRLMVERCRASGSLEDRRKLGKIPLLTTQGWKKDRPVFATDDESLVDALGNSLPLWKPGGELEQFQLLLEPLRVEVIESAAAEVVEADGSIEDPEATRVFQTAVRQLQEDLVRNEPSAAQGLRVRWDDLSKFAVWSHSRLMLAVHVPESAGGGTWPCQVHVKVDVDSRKVFVSDPQSDLPAADRGGRALAALFDGERRRVAQAWRVAWDRAEDGVTAAGLELAQQKAAREKEEMGAEIEKELAVLQTRAGGRPRATAGGHGRGSGVSVEGDRGGNGETGPDAADGAKPRVLVDPELLAVVEPSGRVVGGSPRNVGGPPRRGGGELVEPGGTRPLSPRSRTPLRGYSDQERETVGFELARKVLSSDDEDIVDLRTQRGVGADAMDELERFYELKVSAGDEPNEVTLTSAEWQRAQSSSDFFLVVVSGVEGVESRPSVRIIPRPLDQLEQKVTDTMILSGVRHARSVTYEFAPVKAVSDRVKLDSGAKERPHGKLS